MKKLIILAGLPGSGKSTYVKKHYHDENSFHFDSDETRKSMYGTYLHFPKDMYEIYDHMIDLANEQYDKLIKEGIEDFTFIMDSTFLDNKRRNHYLDRLRKFDKNIIIMFYTTDINWNLKNNKNRIKDKWVPEDVIFNMIKQYEPLDESTRKRFDEAVEVTMPEDKDK